MSAEKPVLLARPHAFIVNEMRPFLEGAGYTPQRLESLDQLAAALARPLRGAIISTAVTSSVNADAATVFQRVRAAAPRLPIVFAGMADWETMRTTAERAVKAIVPSPSIQSPQSYRPAGSLDRDSTFLVLRKDDLIDAVLRESALRALRAHFG